MPYESSLSSGMRSHTLLHALFFLALLFLCMHRFLCTRRGLIVPLFLPRSLLVRPLSLLLLLRHALYHHTHPT